MMQLHPQANVLAECVFQRMPFEGFLDAKKVLLPSSSYDSLLDSGNCEFILNKFEKEDEILRPLRNEYERAAQRLPALSGICEILNRLQEVKFCKVMKPKNYLKVDNAGPRILDYRNGAVNYEDFTFDYSVDYLVTTLRLKDDLSGEDGGAKTLFGEKIEQFNRVPGEMYIFAYYLDREDENIIKPKLIRTIPMIKPRHSYDFGGAKAKFEVFSISGCILAIYRKEETISVDFYDLEKSRRGERDLIYSISDVCTVAWCREEKKFPNLRRRIMYFENYFVVARRSDQKIFAEIHEISSKKCSFVKKFEMNISDRSLSYDGLFIDHLGRSTWNIIHRKPNSQPYEGPAVFYINMMENVITESVRPGAMKREGKNTKQCGHVRLSEVVQLGTDERDEVDYFLKFYA